jgi:hypothetical protein
MNLVGPNNNQRNDDVVHQLIRGLLNLAPIRTILKYLIES